jgi:hypothetical protein
MRMGWRWGWIKKEGMEMEIEVDMEVRMEVRVQEWNEEGSWGKR